MRERGSGDVNSLEVENGSDKYLFLHVGDIIRGGKLRFQDGKMALPAGPGLGVEIDSDQMAKLEENMARVESRDDLVDKWNPSYRRKPGRMFRF